MKVSMLTNREAIDALTRLIRGCTRFDVAVAWAGPNAGVEEMLSAHPKLGRAVIGTHMYQTDPAVLRQFMPHKGARCMAPSGRLFHPKVYLFTMAQGMAAFVGSHNLTGGAFGGKNIEVSVLLEGATEESVFADLAGFIQSSWEIAEKIDEEGFLFAYEAQYKVNKNKRKDLDKFHRLKKPRAGAQASPMDVSWEQFVAAVKGDPHHNVEDRLRIVERATMLFGEYGTYAAMSQYERKAIAGTYGNVEPQLDDLDWAWFGTMAGHGDFKSLVIGAPAVLSSALQAIPADGDVSESQFNEFVDLFERAFESKTHKGGIATGSRLLSMKRPDIFVCLNVANRDGICNAFGTAPTTLSLENYWERVIVPMQNSPWWLHPRPREVFAARIWDNRAALIDSIYYDPSKRQSFSG